ncbi:pyridoxamine 5'-phosphate oxidase family protein [Actinokineospora sp. G85]|uniref:pyridoxamine 5'-phosphate oxidase family protein n=1 Tax=Actinokineospora sp. G85 TaxID=3406626 RepID=UPI003C716BA3
MPQAWWIKVGITWRTETLAGCAAMHWWEDFVAAEPEFAKRVRARFAVRKHGTLATLRKDGSPRISGTEIDFEGGGLWLGSMRGARKALDLLRDPRLAVHCPTEDTPEDDPGSWGGDAKISGLAHDVTESSDSHRFRIEITEVVLTTVTNDGEVVVETWHPGRGLERHVRT